MSAGPAAGAAPGEGRTVLVTGAGGALGPAVARAFAGAGWRVRTLSRSDLTPPADERLRGDVRDEAVVARAVAGVDAVVHLAALLHVTEGAEAREDEYRDVNVRGTGVVARAAGRAGVSRVVLASSIAVYGGSRRGVLDEGSEVRPDTPYSRSKTEAEAVVLGGAGGVALRLAAVYGPGVKGNYLRLARAVAGGRFVPVGPGTNRRTLVFEDDAARAFLIAAAHPDAAGRLYNVTDGSVHTVAAITGAIAGAFGSPLPRWSVPLSLARAGVAAVEAGARGLGLRPPVTRAALEKYTEDVAVSGERIAKELGFGACCGLTEGWRRTAAGLRGGGGS